MRIIFLLNMWRHLCNWEVRGWWRVTSARKPCLSISSRVPSSHLLPNLGNLGFGSLNSFDSVTFSSRVKGSMISPVWKSGSPRAADTSNLLHTFSGTRGSSLPCTANAYPQSDSALESRHNGLKRHQNLWRTSLHCPLCLAVEHEVYWARHGTFPYAFITG